MSTYPIIKRLLVMSVIFCGVFACSPSPSSRYSTKQDGIPSNVPANILNTPDAVPKYEKRTRAGNPDSYELFGKNYKVLAVSRGYQEKGIASWYGTKFHGKKTSNGEIYNMYAMTAAHKTLPIPSYVEVVNLANKRRIVVRINDRGPFYDKRIIDLSYVAAVKLGIHKTGTGRVKVTAIEDDTAIQKQIHNFQAKNGVTFYLQVGAFSRLSTAQRLQDKLLNKHITNTKIPHNNLYKVQIGPFNSVQQVYEARKKLIPLGITDFTLISRETL